MSAKPKAARNGKIEQRERTTTMILDAAERLFSLQGLHGVTLTQVAEEIGVHKTLMNYYYVDKQALYDAVVERRAPITRQLRESALNDYAIACGGKPSVEGALHAFLDTDLDLFMNGGEGWRNWGRFGGQMSNTLDGSEVMGRWFDPLVIQLIDLLQQAMPDMSREDIFWGYHFLTGSLLLTLSRTGRIDRLSEGLCRSDDFAAIKSRMTIFMAAGFDGLRKAKVEPASTHKR